MGMTLRALSATTTAALGMAALAAPAQAAPTLEEAIAALNAACFTSDSAAQQGYRATNTSVEEPEVAWNTAFAYSPGQQALMTEWNDTDATYLRYRIADKGTYANNFDRDEQFDRAMGYLGRKDVKWRYSDGISGYDTFDQAVADLALSRFSPSAMLGKDLASTESCASGLANSSATATSTDQSGSTVWEITRPGLDPTRVTVTAAGLISSIDFSSVTLNSMNCDVCAWDYAPVSLDLPGDADSVSERDYARAMEATRLDHDARTQAKYSIPRTKVTVHKIRKNAQIRVEFRNSNASFTIKAHKDNVRGGAVIWLRNPYTKTVHAYSITKQGSRAVVSKLTGYRPAR